jgi:hypothetical protein
MMLIETAKNAIDEIHNQDIDLVDKLEELEEVQEYLEKAISEVQDRLCEED